MSTNSYTEKMETFLFQNAWDEDTKEPQNYFELLNILNDEKSFRSFGDGLLHFLQRKQPDLTTEKAIKYIEECCKKTSVLISDIASSNTLKSWFKGGPRPKKGDDSRASLFALSFALSLSTEETAELFHKVYLDRAFDFRSEKEIIYYYCLKNRKSWTDAKRLINSIDHQAYEMVDQTVYTSLLKTDLEGIEDEIKLLEYIKTHSYNLEKNNITAKNIVKKLLNEATRAAQNEVKIGEHKDRKGNTVPVYDSLYKNYDKTSHNFVYEVITGLSVSGEKGTRTLFKSARLPKEIRSRFPEANTLSKKNPT